MPMTIAYISSAFLADCDLPLIHEMIKQGVDVCYFLQMSDSSRQATLINVTRLQSKGGVYPATCFPELAHLACYLPLDHIYVVNMPRPKDLDLESLRAVFALWKMLKTEKFDVIHVTSPLRYGSFLLYSLRKKMVLTMHDPIPHSSDRNRLNLLHRWMAFRCVRNFIVLSQSLKDEFIETYGLQKKQVFVSMLGVYTHLKHTKEESLDLPEKYVLFVGSINPHKGIRYLCEAVHLLKEKGIGLNLVIAGRGRFDFDIDSFVSNDQITVINRFITNEELVTLMRRSLFVCCPYINATQSGVIMSAFALDKPVIATRVGALPEMVIDQSYGYLIPPEDTKALAHAIESMLEPNVLKRMSLSIHDDFSHGCRSWQSIAQKTLDIYHTIES